MFPECDIDFDAVLAAYTKKLLSGMAINGDDINGELSNHMKLGIKLNAEFIRTLNAEAAATARAKERYAELAEANRDDWAKATEKRIAELVSLDGGWRTLNDAKIRAEIEHEAASQALKLFYERGQILRSMAFGAQAETRLNNTPMKGQR